MNSTKWTSDEWVDSKIKFSSYWGNKDWLTPLGIPDSIDKLCELVSKESPSIVADVACGKNAILGKELLKRGLVKSVDFFEFVDVNIENINGAKFFNGDYIQSMSKLKDIYDKTICINGIFEAQSMNDALKVFSESTTVGGRMIITFASASESKRILPECYYEENIRTVIDGRETDVIIPYLEINSENSRIKEVVGVNRWRQWLANVDIISSLAQRNNLDVMSIGHLPVSIRGLPTLASVLKREREVEIMNVYNTLIEYQEKSDFSRLPKIEYYEFKRIR